MQKEFKMCCRWQENICLVKFIALYSSVCKTRLKPTETKVYSPHYLLLCSSCTHPKNQASLIRFFLALVRGGCHSDHQLSLMSCFRLLWPFPSCQVKQRYFILLSGCKPQKTYSTWRQQALLQIARVTAVRTLLLMPAGASLQWTKPGVINSSGRVHVPPICCRNQGAQEEAL